MLPPAHALAFAGCALGPDAQAVFCFGLIPRHGRRCIYRTNVRLL